jgi:N-acetylglucosamine kinase-like BadF-type ATPase
MNETRSRSFVIGIDAGGTRTRATLAEAATEGAVLAEGLGGPGNALSVGRQDLTRHLTDAIRAAVHDLPPERRYAVRAVVGGFAGAATNAGPEAGHDLAMSCLRAALATLDVPADGGTVAICDDLEIAFAAAPGSPPHGLVLIAGTGAVAGRVENHRRTALADGDGWLLGDSGSGFWLGREVMAAALRALDGRGPWTSLVEAVTAHYLGTPGGPYLAAERPGRAECERLRNALVPRAYAEPPVRLARLSPLAVAAEAAGDEIATTLLDDAADELAATISALDPRDGDVLVVTGGLLGPSGPLLGRLTARAETLGLSVAPVRDGRAGAVALARLRAARRSRRGVDVD